MPFPEGAAAKGGKASKRGSGADMVALRQRVEMILEENFVQIQKDLAELSPKDRIDAYIRLLDFALPKLQRIDTSVYETNMPLPILSTNGLIDDDGEK